MKSFFIKSRYALPVLLSFAFSAQGSLELADTILFGRGFTLPNPATDRALIVTPDFLIASDQDSPGGREGSVYVYTNDAGAWKFSQKLTDQLVPNVSFGWFGYAIEHSTNSYGEWLAVESTWSWATNGSTQVQLGLTHGTGDIQMFRRNPFTQRWEFFQYVIPPVSDEFGNGVSMDGDWMLCGAYGHFYNSSTNYSYSGAAFFYQFDGTSWVLRQGPLLCNKGTNNWGFAGMTEIKGTNAFIFGRFDVSYSGAVYLYELRDGTWVETGTVRANSPRPAETFGVSYIQCRDYGDPGIKDDLLVVGAPMRNSSFWTGAVYFYQNNGTTWQQIGSYFPTDLAPKTYFANSGDMQGDLCVIGCRFADYTATFTGPVTTDGKGRAYVFRFNGSTWNLEQILAPDSRQQSDWFGSWPATDGTNVYVVSPGAYVNGYKTNILSKFSPYIPPPPPLTLMITKIEPKPEGLFLKWQDVTNRVYTVEAASLIATNWTPAAGVTWPIDTNQVLLPYTIGEAGSFRVKAE